MKNGGAIHGVATAPNFAAEVGRKRARDSACYGTAESTAATAATASNLGDGMTVDDFVVKHNETDRSVNMDAKLEHESVVCCVRYSADGSHFATGSSSAVDIFDATTGERVRRLAHGDDSKEDKTYVRSLAYMPGGKRLVSGAEDRIVRVWDVETAELQAKMEGHELDIYSLDCSSDGKHFVSASGDCKAILWNADAGEKASIFGGSKQGPKDGLTSVAFSPDGKLLAAGSLDEHIYVWDVETGKLANKLAGHSKSVYSVTFTPDGKSLISGSLDRTIKSWDVAGAKESATFLGHEDFVLSVAVASASGDIVSGSKDRTVRVWDARTSNASIIIAGHTNSVISVAVQPSDEAGVMRVVSGSGDHSARMWSIAA